MEFENQKLRSVADVAARIMMGEQLKGGQVKLDKNHNGKIDGQDFKILKGQQKEETMHEESCECGACPSDKDMKKEEVTTRQVKDFHDVLGKHADAGPAVKKFSTDPGNRKKFNKAHDAVVQHAIAATNYDRKYKDMKKEEVEE